MPQKSVGASDPRLKTLGDKDLGNSGLAKRTFAAAP